MAEIIAIANIKGGVGKTTCSTSIAFGMAKRNYKTLLIDLDPQENSTMAITEAEDEDDSLTLYDVLINKKSIEAVRKHIADNLDLVCGSFDLCMADTQLTGLSRSKILGKAIKKIENEYDFIILDCPPNLGVLSLNALCCCSGVIVPLNASQFSLKGLTLLQRTLEEVEEETGDKKAVIGLLLNQFEVRSNISKIIAEELEEASQLFDTSLFNTYIRKCSALNESQYMRENIFDYARTSNASKDFENLCDEILKRLGK